MKRFSSIVGDSTVLTSVKYVITLDSDTELPRDAARQLVGAMAHPLNRAHYDETRERVTKGYGILQPRVVTSLPGSNRSRYARLFGGESGIDPYYLLACLEHYWQRWFERLPRWLSEEPRRARVVSALSRALEAFESETAGPV